MRTVPPNLRIMGKTCCFAGHHDTPERIRPALAEAIERHIVEHGVREFLVGCYGGFDRMAKAEVIKAKARHPGISLYLMLAYLPKEGQAVDREGCDGVIYPEGMETVPYQVAIPRLNQLVINEADHLIAYVAHSWGGAAQTLEHARKRERRGLLTVTNLADMQIPSKCVSN